MVATLIFTCKSYTLGKRNLSVYAFQQNFLPTACLEVSINSFYFLFLQSFKEIFIYLFIYTTVLGHSQLQQEGSLVAACRIQFPDQGMNPGPLHWENRVLTTGPPGKSLHQFFVVRFLAPNSRGSRGLFQLRLLLPWRGWQEENQHFPLHLVMSCSSFVTGRSMKITEHL